MLFSVLRTLRHYPIRLARWPLVAAALAILTAQSDALHGLTTLLVTYAFCCLAPLTLWWAVRWLTPALSTRVWVKRRDDASEHADGVSTVLDVGQHAGPRSIRRRAATLRPSLARASWWTRRRTRSTAYGVKLVQTGFLPAASSVWSSCEEVTLRIGGPRSGKSGSLACHILDAPGALLVTTSRTDLLDNTRAARERRGRVVVFNPTGLGGLKSSVRWSALDGCQDLGTAQRRAADLVPVTWGEGERWDNQARGLLAVLMHAAALAGGTMRTVLDWVSPADLIARDQILDALTTSINVRGPVCAGPLDLRYERPHAVLDHRDTPAAARLAGRDHRRGGRRRAARAPRLPRRPSPRRRGDRLAVPDRPRGRLPHPDRCSDRRGRPPGPDGRRRPPAGAARPADDGRAR
jgi:type IV secretion system protein VirD4